MVGKMVKLRSRLRLEHLKIQRRPPSPVIEESPEVLESPDPTVCKRSKQSTGLKKATKSRLKLDHLKIIPRPPSPRMKDSPELGHQSAEPNVFKFPVLESLEVIQSSEPEVLKSPEREVLKTPNPAVLNSPKLEVLKSPELEVLKSPNPEVLISLEPEVLKSLEPKVLKSPEPEVLKSPEPEVLRSPEPEILKSPEPEILKSPEPEILKSPKPEVFKTPEPNVHRRFEQVASLNDVTKLQQHKVSFPVSPTNDESCKDDDIIGSILELEQDEVSTPKGSRKGKLPKSPDFPRNPNWIKPEVLLDELFDKKQHLRLESDDAKLFVFPSDPNIVLSPHVWQLSEMMALKKELNNVKSSLDLFPLDHWHSHTKKMNIAQLAMSYVKRYFNPEFSSQAWGKMFEILCAYQVIPDEVLQEREEIICSKEKTDAGERVAFDSVHLCEAPGAFISALNHFLKISYPEIDWNWLATTLNPYHESNDIGKMINDDRLILRSMDNWTFLEDKTGNILVSKNLEYLIKEKVDKLDKVRKERSGAKESNVLLVTADGSIDCQINPGEQEAMVTHLQYGEILTALMILQEGGSFILKIFTFLEAATICHLYLLSCVFKEVHLFKPSTSKEGNSEVYVICLKYLGRKSIEAILQIKLLPNLESYEDLLKKGKLLLPLSAIPEVFISRIKESARFFCNYQMKIIRRNSSCFPCDTRMYLLMKPFRKEAAEQWIETSEIRPLPSNARLFTGDADDFKVNKASHVDIKSEQGCFADKLLRQQGNDLQKLQSIKAELITYSDCKGPYNTVVYGSSFKVGPIEFERPYKNIRCSRFCYGKILSSRQEIRDIVQNYMTELQAHGLGNMENICSGHDLKRIYASMGKSCDVERKTLEVLCFSKLTWDYVTKSDFHQQKEDLNKLFAEVQDLGKDRSLFLCRFPLLTRLQTGFIFCLASVFRKIIIYGDPEKNVIGVLLYKYKGLSQPEDKNMFRCFTDILDVLANEEFNFPVLQVVPMKTLLEFMPADFLVRYNMLILCQDMLRTIDVVGCTIRWNKKFTRRSQDLTA